MNTRFETFRDTCKYVRKVKDVYRGNQIDGLLCSRNIVWVPCIERNCISSIISWDRPTDEEIQKEIEAIEYLEEIISVLQDFNLSQISLIVDELVDYEESRKEVD